MYKFIKIIAGILLTSTLLIGCGTQSNTSTEKEPTITSITSEEAKEIIDTDEDIVIIDVREPNEYEEGHIKDSILVPLGTLESTIENIVPNKDTKILVYCRSGNRSSKSLKVFEKLGYNIVYDFGGITDWKYELEK